MQDSKRVTDIKNKLLDSMGEGGCGTIWQNSIKTFMLPYVKYLTSSRLMLKTGHSKLVHWDDPEGWDWEGGGRGGSRWGEHKYTHGRFVLMYGKNHHNIVNWLINKREKVLKISICITIEQKYFLSNKHSAFLSEKKKYLLMSAMC